MPESKLLAKLAEIQKELKVPKNQYNNYGGFNYRSCEDIVEAVKPLCHARGVVLTMYDDVVVYGNRFYIKAHVALSDTETGETIEKTAVAREADSKKGMDESQITGASSSYARKYALNGLFCIDDTKDADTNDYKNQQNQRQNQQNQRQNQNFVCADCGTPFRATSVKLRNGGTKNLSVAEIFAMSQKKNPDGVARCSNCMNKLNQNQKG